MKTHLETYALPSNSIAPSKPARPGSRRLLPIAIILALSGTGIPAGAQSCTATAGPQTASTFSTAALAGSSFPWTNAAGAQTADGSYASGGVPLGVNSSAYSGYLYVQNLGFSIPATATICEIIVEVDRSVTGLGLFATVTDQSVRLLKNGVLDGNDLATNNAWPGSDAMASYGNSIATGLWGSSWQPSDVNNANFGVAISARLNTGLVGLFMTARINQVRVTIVYDPNSILGLTLQHYSVTRTPEGNLMSWTVPGSAAGIPDTGPSANPAAPSSGPATNTPGPDPSPGSTVNPPATDPSANALTPGPSGTGNPPTPTDAGPTAGISPAPLADLFTIQRSADAASWKDLGIVRSTGKEESLSTYTYTDHNPLNGANYYRLRIQSASGKTIWSPVAAIMGGGEKTAIRCWPNPFSNSIQVTGSHPMQQLLLKDAQGRVLQSRQLGTGTREAQLQTAGLPPGLYFLQADNELFRLFKSE